MIGLNDEQWEACSYTEGPLLILAGAGSGKTRVIVHRVAYLLEELDVKPYNILAITFTNKAANEMSERIETEVGDLANGVWVSTFHSMCVRILRRFYDRIGGNNNFTIYDTDDQKTVVKEVIKNLNLDPKQYNDRMCLSIISGAKEKFMTPDDYEKASGYSYREQQIAKIYREYQKRMKLNNALDFDDLIFKTLELFAADKEVLELYQNRFRYIMVDEYQDTNHSQFLLVEYLAGKWRNLCVVGDDDQSIYKFRGADISNILDFEKVYPDAKVVKLEENYRSTDVILNAANAVIANNQNRKSKALRTSRKGGNKISYSVFETEYEEAQGVVNNIINMNIEGRDYRDIAILYRTNAQSRTLEEKLVYQNVPYKLVGGTGFYGRKEIRDMVAYLKLLANSSDEVSFVRIINVPRRGIGPTTVAKIRDNSLAVEVSMYDFIRNSEYLEVLGKSKAKLEDFTNFIESLRPLANEGRLTELYDKLLEDTGYKMELEAEGTDEARTRIENLEELRNKIAGYEESAEEPSLMELLEDISLVADTDDSLEDSDNKVTLMTLHSAKGLEFPVVHIVGMEDGLFPSSMSMDSDDPDAVEEERRLCYVGITRAKDELFLSSASTRMQRGGRVYFPESRFIKEIPKEYMIRKGRRGGVTTSVSSYSSFSTGYSSSKNSGTKSKTDSNVTYSYANKGIYRNESVEVSEIDYKVGDTVRHIKFGLGTVTEMVRTGNEYEVTVDFKTCGTKRMFATLAKLRKVN